MTALVTVGMVTHIALNALVTFTPTRNPILGELRLVLAIIATIALWATVAALIPDIAPEPKFYWPREIA